MNKLLTIYEQIVNGGRIRSWAICQGGQIKVCAVAQNRDLKFVQNVEKKGLDNLGRWWYNIRPGRGAPICHEIVTKMSHNCNGNVTEM